MSEQVMEAAKGLADGLLEYPDYQCSDAPWLGNAPAHWDVVRAKYLYREVDERSGTGDEELLTVSHISGVTRRSQKSVTMFMAESYAGHKVCRPSDLVINTMWAWMGALGVTRQDGLVSPSYGVYRPTPDARLRPEYADLLLRSRPYVGEYVRRSTGVTASRLRLYPDVFLKMPLLVPPVSEQEAVVRFVSSLNGLVNRFVRGKQRLIKLLEEQKQAISHLAVTQGVDECSQHRSSEFEDRAWIPTHWQRLPMKRVLSKLIDCEHKTAPRVDESPYRVVRTSAVKNGRLVLSGTYPTSHEAFVDWTRRGTPEPGDVVFTREAPAGEACIVPHGISLCLGQRTVLLKVDRSLCYPAFLVHLIYNGAPRDRILLKSQGSTVDHFNVDDIAALPLLLPPFAEQGRILEVLEQRLVPLSGLVERLVGLIHHVRQYRDRLVADVVTGKLDVRAAAADLPEEFGLLQVAEAAGLSETALDEEVEDEQAPEEVLA